MILPARDSLSPAAFSRRRLAVRTLGAALCVALVGAASLVAAGPATASTASDPGVVLTGQIAAGDEATGLAVDQKTHELVVVDAYNDQIDFVDPVRNRVDYATDYAFLQPASGLTIDDGTGTVYATSPQSATIVEYNDSTGEYVRRVGDSVDSSSVRFDAASGSLVLGGSADSGLNFVDGFTSASVRYPGTYGSTSVVTGTDTAALAVDDATNTVFTVDPASDKLVSVDASGPKILGTTPVGSNPSAVAVDDATNTVFVASRTDNTVTVVNGSTRAVKATVPVGTDPTAIAVNPLTGFVFVANSSDGTVSIISEATDRVVSTVSLGSSYSSSKAMAIDEATNTIYVADYQLDHISVLQGPQPTASTAAASSLPTGRTLASGASLTSPGSQYRLTMRTTGELVVTGNGRVLWSSHTSGNPGATLAMDPAGAALILSPSGNTLWKSSALPRGSWGGYLTIQDDGNFVVRPWGGTVWSDEAAGSATLTAPSVLAAGQYLHAGAARLLLQTDGNLVAYTAAGKAAWSSHTSGRAGATLKMQSDGNVVVYSTTGKPLWSTKTGGTGTSDQLTISTSGIPTLVKAGKVLWRG